MDKLSVTMASKKETCKKKNYSEAESDVLLMEDSESSEFLLYSSIATRKCTYAN